MKILAHLKRNLHFLLEHWRNMLSNDTIGSVRGGEFSASARMYDKCWSGFFAWWPEFYLNPFLSQREVISTRFINYSFESIGGFCRLLDQIRLLDP
jgi:hypothetical protein